MRPTRTLITLILACALGSTPVLAQQATSNDAPATPDFVLGPSDVIRVWVWGEEEVTSSAIVRPDGKISMPLAGELTVADRTPSEVEGEIRQRLREYIDNQLVVVVIVESINSRQISVIGEVRLPNRFLMDQPLTILDAIALAGGTTEFANLGKVMVIRKQGDDFRSIEVDLKPLLEDGVGAPTMLQPGDTVVVKR